MSEPATYDRFEELEAGRLLGDLDEQEWKEWRELAEQFSDRRESSLELVTAAVETEFVADKDASLPDNLIAVLRDDARDFSQGAPAPATTPTNVVEGDFPKRASGSANAAWAVAALLAALLVASIFTRPEPDEPDVVVTPPLEERAKDLVTPAFAGTEAYAGMSGRVVWSDELQEGYMELTDLAVNDPTVNQYQLWIVDPERSEQPVDGGVFDVGESGTVQIPIDAKLAVDKPAAFVITLEKPGGVVVSSQEVVVAISKVEA